MASSKTYQEFIAAQEAEEYPLNSTQLSGLKTLFSDPSVPVSQVAQEVAAPILKALKETPGAPVDTFIFWRTIAAAVKELPQYNDRLVELVIELQKIPSPLDYLSYMTDFNQHWTEFEFHSESNLSNSVFL